MHNTTMTSQHHTFTGIPFRTQFAWLFAAGMLGVLAYSVFIVTALPGIVAAMGQTEPLPPPALLLTITTLQTGAIVAVAVWGGLMLARSMGFEPTPILAGTVREGVSARLLIGAMSGVLAGLLALAAYWLVFLPVTGLSLNLVFEMPLWLGLGNAFLYGGITEELLMRLGLMTLLLWIAGKVRGDGNGKPGVVGFWIVNVIVTVLFGLGHLPAAVALLGADLSPTLVAMALALNSVGLLFGWLYWRRGLEAAIAAHMGFHVGYTILGMLLN